jgi:hypothetical protein
VILVSAWIASKMVDVAPLTMDQLVVLSQNTIEPYDLQLIEVDIVKRIEFELLADTPDIQLVRMLEAKAGQ